MVNGFFKMVIDAHICSLVRAPLLVQLQSFCDLKKYLFLTLLAVGICLLGLVAANGPNLDCGR